MIIYLSHLTILSFYMYIEQGLFKAEYIVVLVYHFQSIRIINLAIFAYSDIVVYYF